MPTVTLKPISRNLATIRITSISPLVEHQWSEKAKKQMRDKHAGKKTKTREVRDPEAECTAAAYKCSGGEYGFPADGLKKCLINAAHKDIGLEKTLLRKSLFIRPFDEANNLLKLETDEPIMREDIVRVGAGSTDLRYRPEFREWGITLTLEFDAESISISDVVNLFQRAGFGVGLGEMRPEKSGDYGRFEVDPEFEITVEEIKERTTVSIPTKAA
jgi:hypothetical protein